MGVKPTAKKTKAPWYDLEFVKQIPLEKVLGDYGIKINKGSFAIRDERTPSCRTYPNNTWADFGGSTNHRGGTVIDLVKAIEGIEWKEALQLLGARYGAPILNAGKPLANQKILSDTQYSLIGLFGSPVYKNILVPEHAESFTAQNIISIQRKFDISMNQLFTADIRIYADILRNQAAPFMRSHFNAYLKQLYDLKQAEKQYTPRSMEVRLVKNWAAEAYRDYAAAYKVLEIAVKGTDIEISRIKPNYAKDYKGIEKKSIEIGEFPYANLKNMPGDISYLSVPHQAYTTFNNEVLFGKVQIEKPYSAHLRGDTVTFSCKKADEAMFNGMFRSLAAMSQPSPSLKTTQKKEFKLPKPLEYEPENE